MKISPVPFKISPKPAEPVRVISNMAQLDYSDESEPVRAIINKPIESPRPALINLDPALIQSTLEQVTPKSEQIKIKPIPLEKQFDDCQYRGIIRKPNGEEFVGSAQIHQKHSRSFSCLDVIFMEQASGRHIPTCIHTGYLSATKCCVKKDKV